jgi:hypothetical protein
MAKKRVAALTIWNAYNRAKYDPNYRMCKSFIARQTKEYSMSSRVITRVSKAGFLLQPCPLFWRSVPM